MGAGVTYGLEPLGLSTIGDHDNRMRTHRISVFRCADGSRFAYSLNGASRMWAMPDERTSP